MTPKNARKLVAQQFPQHEVQEEKFVADAARLKPAVEMISPSLNALKQLYFSDNAAAAPPVQSDSDDSGIVVVERKHTAGESSAAQALVFEKGKIIGRQG